LSKKVDLTPIVKSFFREHSLVDLQINSFNRFIREGMQEVVDEMGDLEIQPNLIVKFSKIEVGSPRIREPDGVKGKPAWPYECRIRGLTYEAPIELEISIIEDGLEVKRAKEQIGSIPIMLKSDKCTLKGRSPEELYSHGEDPLDPGGYFIIRGTERVIVPREDLATNRLVISRESQSSKIEYIGRLSSKRAGRRCQFVLEIDKTGAVYVNFPTVNTRIPVGIVLKALGLVVDRDIVDAVSDDDDVRNELLISLEESSNITTREQALEYIGRRCAIGQPREERIKRADEVLRRYLLPHIGMKQEDHIKKAYFIAKSVEKLIKVYLGKLPVDDKDSYGNKRLLLAGDLLQELFRVAFQAFRRELKSCMMKVSSMGSKAKNPLKSCIQPRLLKDIILRAMATGNWTGRATGVTQMLDRTNYLSALSHLRRVNSPLSRSQPHFEARELHPTTYGRFCPCETPEGTNCGLVKNLSILIDVTVEIDPKPIEETCYDLGVIPLSKLTPAQTKGKTPVYLNQVIIGFIDNPEEFVKEFRERRRRNLIPHEVNVAYIRDKNEVYINADAGRIRRPLVPVEKLDELISRLDDIESGKLTFTDLLKMGLVEMIDADEEENLVVAPSIDQIKEYHTHVEIAPYAIFGLSASTLPWLEHNGATRNVMGANMTKQALGIYAANWQFRVDKQAHLLLYPQRPIVDTRLSEILGLHRRPFGQNFVVAIACFEGYNMEDALVMNKSSLDRGLARSVYFRCYEAEEKKYRGGVEDSFEIPESDVSGRRADNAYVNLGDDGLAEIEQYVEEGDVIIGKTSPPRFISEYLIYGREGGAKRRDTSVVLKHGESGIVTTVFLTESEEGNRVAKVKIRDTRIPEIGDKFSTRHGQKGVIGMIYRQEDLPFNEDGITPDVVLNPHAIVSRMTVGQLLELIAGKLGCLEGRIVDGTPFVGEEITDIREALKKLGFAPSGREVMYDGVTGEMMEFEIFIGVGFYRRLHHIVKDKLHARARGPVQILTRQPTEGRAREGGGRFGEMEKEALLAHGSAMSSHDRLAFSSDLSTIYVCRNCGMLAYYDYLKGVFRCLLCGTKGDIVPVRVSYAFAVLLKEMISAGIYPAIHVEEVI